ncbi:LysR family transcriptional regulator [Paraburkholderia sp. MMS20-SJTR3]|uniref:LysR family transcriptional regulator n=1 Tax=Paraburkholderia sejongensis TaxID=2886946 RepID=A0ABS8JRG6_9BURK|nr:LysR substrate-binding domain-containing protein [Paraburkholderia sp. MMS20-SJTR3]MCC8392501.1 LysR family transcriptional regulator [Paraburkholderia sp. MMS20-SJTR3]
MRRLPSLNAVRFFDVAARSLNLSAAAAELCVTHSAVSHQIRQLEDWLGCPLFVRHAGGVRLTAAGERLQTATGQALDQLERCCADIAGSAGATELVLGAPSSFLANWLIPRLASFEATHPEIRLHLHTCGELDALEKQRVDALIVSGRDWPRTVAATVLFEDRVGPVCVPALAAGLNRPLDVAGLPLLHTRSHPDAWPAWMEAQGLNDPAFTTGREFDHLPLMLEAAAAGLGIAVAPSLLLTREIESQRLLAPFGFVACGASFAYCVLKARAEQPELRKLCEWLTEQTPASD